MNLKKAVELADGWEWEKSVHGNEMLTVAGGIDLEEHELVEYLWQIPRPFLDALAAQLVRQVDAIDGMVFSVNPYCVHVFKSDGSGKMIAMDSKHKDDRTENTINAIVESGVLE